MFDNEIEPFSKEREAAMSLYLITHGERNNGVDPKMTENGIAQIELLRTLLPKAIALVVVGTGARFQQIYRTLSDSLQGIAVKYSPFCGSADGLDPGDKIVLIDGTLVNRSDYLGLIRAPGFNAWEFLRSLPDGTLLCAGSELMISLGLERINKKGQLFELDPAQKAGRKIS